MASPAEVIQAISTTLRRTISLAHTDDDRPAVLQTLVEQIGDGPFLLVLDNCEHVLDEVTTIVERLLENCPRLGIVATSRERLSLAYENVHHLGPLEVPDAQRPLNPDSLPDALALFLDRARLTTADLHIDDQQLDAIRRICRQLDGLPLAIQLAAAHLDMMSPGELADQLAESFDLLQATRAPVLRHRSLEAAMCWSFELLDDDLQRSLEMLSCAKSPFSVDTAAALMDVDRTMAASVIGGLRRASLIELDTRRSGLSQHSILQPIREFALAAAEQTGAAPASQLRHAETFLQLAADRYEATLGSPSQPQALGELNDAMPDLATAVRTLLNEGRWDDAATLGANLGPTVTAHRRITIGYATYRAVLEHPQRVESVATARLGLATAVALIAAGPALDPRHLARTEVEQLLDGAADLAERLSAPAIRLEVQSVRGGLLWVTGDSEAGISMCEEVLTTSRDLGLRRIEMTAHLPLAGISLQQGRLADAVGWYRKGIELADELNDFVFKMFLSTNLGLVLRLTGDYQGAAEAYGTGHALAARLGVERYAAVCAVGRTLSLAMAGGYPDAATAAKPALRLSANRPAAETLQALRMLYGTTDFGVSPEQIGARLQEVLATPRARRTAVGFALLLDLEEHGALQRADQRALNAVAKARSALV